MSFIVYIRGRQTAARGPIAAREGKSAAREHVIFLNGMRPAKENFVAREHVKVARWAKYISSKIFFGNSI